MSEATAIVKTSPIVKANTKLGYLLKAAKLAAGSTGHAATLSGNIGLAAGAKGAELALTFTELLVEGVNQNQKAKQEANAATLLNLMHRDFEKRVRQLEEASDKDKDLFEHVISKALEDDEARKMPFYNAVLSWVLTGNQGATRVKILTDAVRTLTYVELYAFYVMVNNQRQMPELPQFLSRELFQTRIINAGLGQVASISSNTQATPLGATLHLFAKEEPLEMPTELQGG